MSITMNFGAPVKRQVWTQHVLYSNATLNVELLKEDNKEDQYQFEFKITGTRTLFWVSKSNKAIGLLEPYAVALYNATLIKYCAEQNIEASGLLDEGSRLDPEWVFSMLESVAEQNIQATVKVATSGNGRDKKLVYCYNDGSQFKHNSEDISKRIERAKKRAENSNSSNGKGKTAADANTNTNLDAPPPSPF